METIVWNTKWSNCCSWFAELITIAYFLSEHWVIMAMFRAMWCVNILLLNASRVARFTSVVSAIQVIKEKLLILPCLLIYVLVDEYIHFGNRAKSIKSCFHCQGNAINEIGDPKNIYLDTKYWSVKQFGKTFDELVLHSLLQSWILPLEFPNKDKFKEKW